MPLGQKLVANIHVVIPSNQVINSNYDNLESFIKEELKVVIPSNQVINSNLDVANALVTGIIAVVIPSNQVINSNKMEKKYLSNAFSVVIPSKHLRIISSQMFLFRACWKSGH